MGSQTAYMCDGPDCNVLTTREKGAKVPLNWPHAIVSIPGLVGAESGSFHEAACLHAWVDKHLGITSEPAAHTSAPAAGPTTASSVHAAGATHPEKG